MQNETINHLRHVLASQLKHGMKIEADLNQAVSTVNGLLELVEVMTSHINSLHDQLGLAPMTNEFAGMEYRA